MGEDHLLVVKLGDDARHSLDHLAQEYHVPDEKLAGWLLNVILRPGENLTETAELVREAWQKGEPEGPDSGA